MKKLLLILPLVFLLCFTFACQDKEAMAELEEFRAQATLEEANMALVMRLTDAFKNHDIEAMKEIYSADLISHTPQGDKSLEEALESTKQEYVMFPNVTISIEDSFAKGDKVATRFTWIGTHEGDIEGFPATGKEVELNGLNMFRIENGKVVEEWFEYDNLSFYQQLGFELKPKEEEK